MVELDNQPSLEEVQHSVDEIYLMHDFIANVWRGIEVPKDWRDAIIIHLYKGKVTRKLCGNSRGITLLSVAGKILAFVLILNQSIVDNILPESQCGFCPHRGSADMIFTAHQMKEKCYEQ